MLGTRTYKTKKELKSSVGQELKYYETAMVKAEYTPNGKVLMVGPDAYNKRVWYATITLLDGKITAVK